MMLTLMKTLIITDNGSNYEKIRLSFWGVSNNKYNITCCGYFYGNEVKVKIGYGFR